MGQRVLVVRHGEQKAEDRIVQWLGRAGFVVDIRKPFAGDALGVPGPDLAGTVICGGMQNVYETDKHPSLKEEYRWIDACLKADVPMLGICQGAQQIAYHLGAWAGARAEPVFEFGCHRVEPTPEAGDFMDGPLWVTQAHFHTFDLPEGAVRLARNDTYENQAFRVGDKVFGTQYHPEAGPEVFKHWQADKDDFYSQPGQRSHAEDMALLYQHDAAQTEWLDGFLTKLFGAPR